MIREGLGDQSFPLKAEMASDRMLGRLLRFHPGKLIHSDDVPEPDVEPVKVANVIPLPVPEPIKAERPLYSERPSINLIVEQTASFYSLSTVEIAADRRSSQIVWPRHIAIWLCRQLTTHSFPVIGRKLGGRDHTTCLHACRRVDERLAADERFADEINVLKLHIAQKLLEAA